MQRNYLQSMKYTPLSNDQNGSLFLPFIIVLILFIASLGFGLWAYSGMSDYKNNTDKKIADASEIVKQQTASEKDKEFAEREKSPYKSYTGPITYGGVSFQYPKTWSAYIADTSNGSDPVDGYMHPDFVPAIQTDTTTAYALRIKITSQTYDEVVKQYEDGVSNGKVKLTPFRAAKVPSVLGSRVDGEVNDGQKDSLILIPLRDKTLEIWTESDIYVNDFNNTIIPSLTFSP